MSTKRYLGDETFQREIMVSPINASKGESLLWIVERQVSQVFIPFLKFAALEDSDNESLNTKMKNDLLPCLRSFTSSLRVAEEVWQEGVLLKQFPPEASEIKCLDDSWALLKVCPFQHTKHSSDRGRPGEV